MPWSQNKSYNQSSLMEKPFVSIALAVILVLITFVLEQIGSTEDTGFMLAHGALYWVKVQEGEYWRLFTAMFLHFGVTHLVNNVAMLLILGCQLEMLIGHTLTGVTFLVTGFAGNICSVCYYMATNQYTVCAGASGAIYGLMGALCVMLAVSSRNPRTRQNLAVRILILVVLVVYGSVSEGNVDVIAHAGGLIAGFLIAGIYVLCMRISVKKRRN
ncbi:MAG: rhomboid family intramembrane serine protease [Lachnospiraceae bacterium]|nr:rhomboid family intramembrane serine protease [Lachnospiraceae bacterium]